MENASHIPLNIWEKKECYLEENIKNYSQMHNNC